MVTTQEQAHAWLCGALRLTPGQAPFPWQIRLLEQFREGRVVRALDLPTGLGKTSVMAIWLVARALGARLPRRLVYVVDRRAVVDQATEVAMALRSWVRENREVALALELARGELPISTLRGQFVDNREWLDDPTSPAIIVGTVDMIGSRLLFEGYSVSRKMRPYQAALMGCDSLLVLDEAHLVPPFERLVESIAEGRALFGPIGSAAELIPPLALLSLSATGRDHGDRMFRLDARDLENEVVMQRIAASKQLQVEEAVPEKALPDRLSEAAWELAESLGAPVRCIVFCHRRADAEKAQSKLQSLAREARGKTHGVRTELFVGGRRVRERTQAARALREMGFLAGSDYSLEDHAFLIATSAAEGGRRPRCGPHGVRSRGLGADGPATRPRESSGRRRGTDHRDSL
jgi:CRISPR-associated endonuclease/helicase Cas3